MTLFLWWVCVFFSDYRWARRLLGGRWELWWVDPCCAFIWHTVGEWSTDRTRPAPVCRGTPTREEHGAPVLGGRWQIITTWTARP